MKARFVGQLLKYKFHLLIFFLSFFALTRFYIDADLGWHIAIGRTFLEGQGIIRNDPFSWTMRGHFWGNSYFLYQIVVAWLFKNAGYLATVFLFGILASFSVILLLPKKLTVWSFAVVLIGVLMASTTLGIKPQVFDFLFFAVLMLLLERGYFKSLKLAPFWLVFFALWANLHAGFLVGLLTFSAFVIVQIVRRRKFGHATSILLLATAWLGTLLTPFNFQIWKAIFFDSTSPLGLLYVYEWQPIVHSLKLMTIYLASCLLFIQIFRKRAGQIEAEWFFFGAVLFMLPFVSYFYLFFWAEFFIFFGSRYFTLDGRYFNSSWFRVLAYLVIGVLALLVVFDFGTQLGRSKSLNQRLFVDGYPVDAMNFIVSNGYTKRLFNHFNWGGFIDWQYPGVAVFIDGRMNGWRTANGRYIFDDFIRIVRGKCDSLPKYKPKAALLQAGSNESCFSGWRTVYSDSIAKVLVGPE